MKIISLATLLMLPLLLCSCPKPTSPSGQSPNLPRGWQPQNNTERLCLTSNAKISTTTFPNPASLLNVSFDQSSNQIPKNITGQLDKNKSIYYAANLKVKSVQWVDKVVYDSTVKEHTIASIRFSDKGNQANIHNLYSSLLIIDSYVNLPSGQVVNERDCHFIGFEN